MPFFSGSLFASFAWPLVAVAAGGVAVAAPVLIHLLSRQRFQIVSWAAMRFLQAAPMRHRRRIDHWLLLIARIGVLLLILAGMCAPLPWAERLWQSISPGPPETIADAPRTHHILVLDATLSMSARNGDTTRFQKAAELAEGMVRNANPGDGFSVVMLGGPSSVLVPGPANQPEKVAGEIRSLRNTHLQGDLLSGLPLIADIVGRSPRNYPRRQVTFFTDLQRSAWAAALPAGDRPAPDLWQRILAKAEIACVDVGEGDRENLTIGGMTLADPLPLVNAPTALTATIQNFGKTDRRGVRLELLLGRPSPTGPDANLLPVEQKTIESIPAGEKVVVSFVLDGASRFREPGLHLLRLKLVEDDSLAEDDIRQLAVQVRSGVTCLLVNGQPSAEPLRRGTEYLLQALDPGGRSLPGNPARPRVVSLAEFGDAGLSDLANVDCVFLCDVPALSASQIGRLEAFLKRGGGLVIGMGPNVAANLAEYNRVLFDDGKGLLPGKLTGVRSTSGPNDPGFRLAADDDAYRRPPLDAFRDDNARGGLTAVPFKKYVTLDISTDGRAKRILNFISAKAGSNEPPDAALVEMPRHRGKVIAFTSTWNSDWTDWPVLPSFLPFAHELLRHATAQADRHTVLAGETIEEYPPASAAGTQATIIDPNGIPVTVAIANSDDGPVLRHRDTDRSGLYRVQIGGRKDRVFAVNVPDGTSGNLSESNLARVDGNELRSIHPDLQVVDSTEKIAIRTDDGRGVGVTSPRPHGPIIARWILIAATLALLLELAIAWRVGPGRTAVKGKALVSSDDSAKRVRRILLALIPLLLAGFVLFTVFHHRMTGSFLGFLPDTWRGGIERMAGVPAAGPGEGIRWRLESFPVFVRNSAWDRTIVLGVAVALFGLSLLIYRAERRAVGPFKRLAIPLALRSGTILLLLYTLLPQLRLAFDREGWPDVVILLDTSASMSTSDPHRAEAVREVARQLERAGAGPEATRIALARTLLTQADGGWLSRLVDERQVKVHVFTIDELLRPAARIEEPDEREAAMAATARITADGPGSHLGDGVEAVLKAFRGGSLAAIIMATDGQTTSGVDLPRAAREAARASVPLYLVGFGDVIETPDAVLSDLRADDVAMKNDEIVFDARLAFKGGKAPPSVPVTLSELKNGKLVELARETVRPDTSGAPIPFRLKHTPTEAGEKTFIIETPTAAGEVETANNRIERVILVTETKRLKVLLIDGSPRYEFRFVKSLFERESETVRGNKSIDLQALLLDASRDFALQDRSAIRAMPTREELFQYDAIILGDIDPKQWKQPGPAIQDLVDFVKVRGGGMLVVAGERGTPHKLFETPLADILPILPAGTPRTTPEETPITESYRPRLTPIGTNHPLFRFHADDTENAKIWSGLKPLLWYAPSYKRKLSAEVLAVHPDKPAAESAGENHPLVLQQFVGGGRVLFFGFDETWRWRWREGEERFNQFWIQAVRVLGRNRVRRTELRTDRQTPYRRDEPIRITVRFPDDAPAPPPEAVVRIAVDRSPLPGSSGDSESQFLQLAKVEGSRATYEALITRTPEGQYRFRLVQPETPGTPPRAEAKVLPPPGERERLEMNVADLTRAAAESRGQFFTLANVRDLIDALPEAERVPLNQPCPPLPLWNHAASFGLIFLLLAAEWLYRRRERLV